jgi:hypothetical protein
MRILKNRDCDQQPEAHGRFSLPEKKKGGGPKLHRQKQRSTRSVQLLDHMERPTPACRDSRVTLLAGEGS